MLEDYKKAVISNYHDKKEKGLLSLNLAHPTPAKLRNESIVALRSRTKKEDDAFIKDFFNFGTKLEDYSRSIERFDADKLRPLVKFLKGLIEDTDPRNVELLAWLIDFEPRPYKFGVDYVLDIKPDKESGIPDKDEEKEEGSETLPELTKEREFEKNSSFLPTKNSSIARKAIVPMMVLSLVTIGVYLYTNHGIKAYICDKGSARKYHLSDKCPALKNCKDQFVQTSIAEAEKNGKTLCGFEHK
ncbi:hypothetical protein [Pedobacter foliorum]|uniref:hypothetical protein n=1 Tax=Pedobacter foliorum TaxID=2739058 RepID=UPI00156428D9|nr:hypothetical protein [Pedobacter foliorum]NRF37751.1 hypothetical protein [Pedobacter foliorum]